MQRPISVPATLALCALAFGACQPTAERPGPRVDELVGELDLQGPTFAGQVPEGLQTVFEIDSSQVTVPPLSIDAAGDRVFFPLLEKPRQFADRAELADFFRDSFGALDEVADDQFAQTGVSQDATAGQEPALVGAYAQNGASYFYDPDPGVQYEIVDPLLAYLGGASGMLGVGTESICIDPDGECENGYPSYLEPRGFTTAARTLDVCGSTTYNGTPVCVRHHSFWHSTWFFGDYKRHGTNIRMTTWPSLPSTVLSAAATLRSRHLVGTAPTLPGFAYEVYGRAGANSVEMAFYCWGGCTYALQRATAVCGETTVSDPDINSSARTGNGPENARWCPP